MAAALRFAGMAALLLCAACGRRDEPSAKVRFVLDGHPEPEHGGYFQTLAKGYYAEAGLGVDLLSGTPRLTAVRRVAGGEAQFGLSSSTKFSSPESRACRSSR